MIDSSLITPYTHDVVSWSLSWFIDEVPANHEGEEATPLFQKGQHVQGGDDRSNLVTNMEEGVLQCAMIHIQYIVFSRSVYHVKIVLLRY